MAEPETIIDPDTLIRVGRAAVDFGRDVDACAGSIDLGATGVPDAAARATLLARTQGIAARLRHNGRSLEQLGQEFRELDSAVSRDILLLLGGWR